MSLPPLRLDVVSDVVCPWCYLGKRRLDAALRDLPGIAVEIAWRPFQLDATIPAGGMPRDEYLRRKFGPDSRRIDAAHARLNELGAAVGIDYRFERIERAANTLDAHRLIRWAGDAGLQDEMVERLFRLNFSEGADVGSPDVLAAAAAAVGLDGSRVAEKLADGTDADAVTAEIEFWQRAGVTGVPTFVLDRRYAVVGAQETEVLVRAIRTAAEAAGSASMAATA